MGIKLNALGVSLALIFAHWFAPLFLVGAIISAVGIVLLFLDK